jgi:aspartyl-tRNA(Asn)/glutamyl-tRNA(Gln) amidotransferase subunit A
MNNLLELEAFEIARRVRAGELSAVAVLEATWERIQAVESQVGAFLTLLQEVAQTQARAVDARVKAGGDPGPMAGIPVAVKDNIHVRDAPTTCASRILEGFRPPVDATVIRRLREAGAVFVGKTNLDEFAMGSSCENSALGVTRNPWDPKRVPGGSSGGSAAAVAAHEAHLALGSDTGGSIRLPASFCGVVGVKPSYGRVSRSGLVAFASSLDQIGPFARSVRDASLCLSVIAGRDPRDSTSLDQPVPDYAANLRTGLAELRVGVVRSHTEQMPNREASMAVERAYEHLRALGAELVEVELPHADFGVAVYYVTASAEASSNLARFDGVRYGPRREQSSGTESYFATRGDLFGPEVKRRIMLGTYALSAGHYEEFYGRAARVRALIQRDFELAFTKCDVIAGPCAPFPAFVAGEKSDPLSMYLCDVYTIPGSMAGLCAVSLPAGYDGGGLPLSVQLQAPPLQEQLLLASAHALEGSLMAELASRACLA